jgi:putative transposase
MPRRPRRCPGGHVYHVLNRAVARITLFRHDKDYAAFERTLAQAQAKFPLDIFAWCVMPNHWHLVLRPTRGDDTRLSQFMQWLTLTHAQRWRTSHHTVGYGPLYQGRFKAFPIQRDDAHLLTVLRYVERNPLRAGLVKRAQDWPWSSLRHLHNADKNRDGDGFDRIAEAAQAAAITVADPDHLPRRPPLAPWPIEQPSPADWLALVNRPQTRAEEEALQQSIHRSRPFGDPEWQKKTAAALDLQSSLNPPGRPRRRKQKPTTG